MPKTSFTRLVAFLILAPGAVLSGQSGGTVLDPICPGTSDTELLETLGAPLVTEKTEGFNVSTWSQPEAGIAGATTWSDADGTIRWARIRLVNELPPEAVELLFSLVGGQTVTEGHSLAKTDPKTGLTRHYRTDGVLLFITDNLVREIWRTPPGADLDTIRTTSAAIWPWELPEDVATVVAGDHPTTPDPAASVPTQLLSVGPIEAFVVPMEDEFGVALKGRVHAVGLEGEEIIILGLFFAEDGQDIMKATPEAPDNLKGKNDEFLLKFTDTVQSQSATWGETTFLFPLRFLKHSGSILGRYVLRLEAYCGGKKALNSLEIHLRHPDQDPGRPERRILLVDEPQVEEASQDAEGDGLLIKVPAEVEGCLGSQFRCLLVLFKPDGTPVMARSGWDNWRNSQGGFYGLRIATVEYDHSHWNPYRIFLPYAALDLPPGETTLTVRILATSENVAAALEFDHTFVQP